MKKMVAQTCLALALLLACFRNVEAQSLDPYPLTVRFEGLVAFVPSKIDTQPVLWALLPDANYNPETATTNDLPPCVWDEGVTDPNILRRDYPHHIAALRVQNAKISLNGVSITGLIPAVLLQGRDLWFNTGKKISAIPALPQLTNADELHAARGGSLSDYTPLDKVNADYLKTDSTTVMSLRFLAARALIDFGDSITTNPLSCGGVPVRYGFRRPNFGTSDCKGNTPLAEDLIVHQADLTAPVIIELRPSADKLTIEPASPRAHVVIEVLNVMPKAIADPYYQPCDDRHQHPTTFRWYYHLLASIKADCPDHFVLCEGQGTQGGTKCPLKGLTE